MPGFIRNCLFSAVELAEKKLARPVTYIEIHASVVNTYGHWGFKWIKFGYVVAFLQNMYREDIFYADKNFVYWTTSLTGGDKAGFENFSDRFRKLFPGYVLDSTMHIRAGPKTKTLNLQELMKLFNSSDEQQWKQNAWIFENERKYLDGSLNKSNKVGF